MISRARKGFGSGGTRFETLVLFFTSTAWPLHLCKWRAFAPEEDRGLESEMLQARLSPVESGEVAVVVHMAARSSSCCLPGTVRDRPAIWPQALDATGLAYWTEVLVWASSPIGVLL